jgi:pimeloyl-ACP methyl ester carboxylesterase
VRDQLVLVHGAWHSGSGFSALQEELEKVNIGSTTIELTSAARPDEPIGDMYQDAALVANTVKTLDSSCFVLGHSYGGLPVTQGLSDAPNVRGLIYLTAFVLDKGETLYAACGDQDPEWWIRDQENLRLTPADPQRIFYNTCSVDRAMSASRQLRTQSLSSFNQTITQTAWSIIPSTYIICEQDNAIPVFAQEAMSGRCQNVYRMDTDHSPFLSAPKPLAELIRTIIDQS